MINNKQTSEIPEVLLVDKGTFLDILASIANLNSLAKSLAENGVYDKYGTRLGLSNVQVMWQSHAIETLSDQFGADRVTELMDSISANAEDSE